MDPLVTYCSGMTRWIGGKILIQSLPELTLPSTQRAGCCEPTIATIIQARAPTLNHSFDRIKFQVEQCNK